MSDDSLIELEWELERLREVQRRTRWHAEWLRLQDVIDRINDALEGLRHE